MARIFSGAAPNSTDLKGLKPIAGGKRSTTPGYRRKRPAPWRGARRPVLNFNYGRSGVPRAAEPQTKLRITPKRRKKIRDPDHSVYSVFSVVALNRNLLRKTKIAESRTEFFKRRNRVATPAPDGLCCGMLFERQRVLLTLLDAIDEPVAHTDFQKLLFLFAKEWQETPSYEFVPYRFGGFSFTSYADKKKLISKGLLAEDEHKVLGVGPIIEESIFPGRWKVGLAESSGACQSEESEIVSYHFQSTGGDRRDVVLIT